MTDNTTDDTEQPSRDELENRVEQLEQTVQQMLPSRRDALKLGGTALAAGALGSAATGSASAGTNSVGTIGSASSPVDAELEDVNPGSVRAVNFNNNEITGVSSLSTDSLTVTDGVLSQQAKAFMSTSSTASPVPLDTTEFDPNNNFDTANNEYVAPETGVYLISMQLRGGGSVTTGTDLNFRVFKNSSTILSHEVQFENGRAATNAATLASLSSGDVVGINNKNNAQLRGNGRSDTHLSVIKVS